MNGWRGSCQPEVDTKSVGNEVGWTSSSTARDRSEHGRYKQGRRTWQGLEGVVASWCIQRD